MEHQGPDITKRDFLHTSLTHIGHAYEKLREIGVPKEHIIVIVQLKDFLRSPHMVEGNYAYDSVISSCGRLIAEGGVDYDFELVNPGTVWSVLLSLSSDIFPKVVPIDATVVFFAIYSHGDAHPVHQRIPLRKPLNHLTHEWFAHMPYPTQSHDLTYDMLDFVSVAGTSKGSRFHTPERYLYSTQLRRLLIKMFAMRPERPVIGLLNYCLSGSCQEFMKRSVAREYYGADSWPLFLMSASQSTQDALIGGLWTAFFCQAAEYVASLTTDKKNTSSSVCTTIDTHNSLPLGDFFHRIKTSYFQRNVYELYGHVAQRAYAATPSGRLYSQYPIVLKPLLCGGDGGEPDYEGLRMLQQEWRGPKGRGGKGVKIWLTDRWQEEEADIAEVVREARSKIVMSYLGRNLGWIK